MRLFAKSRLWGESGRRIGGKYEIQTGVRKTEDDILIPSSMETNIQEISRLCEMSLFTTEQSRHFQHSGCGSSKVGRNQEYVHSIGKAFISNREHNKIGSK